MENELLVSATYGDLIFILFLRQSDEHNNHNDKPRLQEIIQQAYLSVS